MNTGNTDLTKPKKTLLEVIKQEAVINLTGAAFLILCAFPNVFPSGTFLKVVLGLVALNYVLFFFTNCEWTLISKKDDKDLFVTENHKKTDNFHDSDESSDKSSFFDERRVIPSVTDFHHPMYDFYNRKDD